MDQRETFPWPRLMQIGITSLGLAPSEFWRCTLREITAALGPATRPLQRQNLEALMDEWPDE